MKNGVNNEMQKCNDMEVGNKCKSLEYSPWSMSFPRFQVSILTVLALRR